MVLYEDTKNKPENLRAIKTFIKIVKFIQDNADIGLAIKSQHFKMIILLYDWLDKH